MNLYFNQHLDLNLAEQDAPYCSGDGDCTNGGSQGGGSTLDYFTTTGVVNEACFTYSASDLPCSDKCKNPAELIQISGKIRFAPASHSEPEEELKRLIIEYGPASGRIADWSHTMTLAGYGTVQEGDVIYAQFLKCWYFAENALFQANFRDTDIKIRFAFTTGISTAIFAKYQHFKNYAPQNLVRPEKEMLRVAATLHDVGKIAIPGNNAGRMPPLLTNFL